MRNGEIFPRLPVAEKSPEEQYAQKGLGIYNPPEGSIIPVLNSIAEKNELTTDWGGGQTLAEQAAYYIGYSMVGALEGTSRPEEPVPLKFPYAGLARVEIKSALGTRKGPKDVLRFGIGSEVSLIEERAFWEKMGVKIRRHIVSDPCQIPLERSRAVLDRQSQPYPTEFIRSLGNEIPLPEGSVDFATTDLLLAGLPDQVKGDILGETRRVLVPGGRLVMRVLAGPTRKKDKSAASVGHVWWERAVEKYGVEDERDGLAKMTRQQWEELGNLYAGFIRKTYHEGGTKPRDWGEVHAMLTDHGLKVRVAVDLGNDREASDDTVGIIGLVAAPTRE